MLTRPRSGSSWTSTLLAKLLPSVLPLFELYNAVFALAHLQFYNVTNFRSVKGLLGAELLAPLLPFGSPLYQSITSGSLTAIGKIAASPNRTLHLGNVIYAQPAEALRLVERFAVEHGFLGGVSFKVLQPPQGDVGLALGRLLTTFSHNPAVTWVLLQRNFFHRFVSEYKVEHCEGGAFQNWDSTQCKPRINLQALRRDYAVEVRAQAAYLRYVDACAGTGQPTSGRARDLTAARVDVSPAAPGCSTVVHVSYEEIEGLSDAAAMRVLAPRLHLASTGWELEAPAEGTEKGLYTKQDRGGALKDKIANYVELANFYAVNLTYFCRRLAAPGAHEDVVCADPAFQLPL